MQAETTVSTFSVTISSANNPKMTEFWLLVPSLKYLQDDANTCFYNSFASATYSSIFSPEQAIAACIQA